MATFLVHAAATINTSGYSAMRSLARGSTGRLWCCYKRDVAGLRHAFVAYSDDEGATWNEEQVSTIGSNLLYQPAIAVDPSDNVHVVYDPAGYGTFPLKKQIVYRQRLAGVWQAEELVTDIDANQEYPVIAIHSNNDVSVAWNSVGFGVQIANLNPAYRRRSAGVWGAVEKLVDSNRNQNPPSIAIGSDNDVHALWTGYLVVNQNHAYYRRRTGVGWQALEEVTPINARPQYVGSIALDPSGEPHVLWCGQGYGVNIFHRNIQYCHRAAGVWGAVESLTDIDSHQHYPTIEVDRSNNVHAIWPGLGWGVNPGSSNLQYNTKVVGGAWGAQVGLTDAAFNNGPGSSAIWAIFPIGQQVPKTGYAFVWNKGADVWIWISADISWAGPPAGVSPASKLVAEELI